MKHDAIEYALVQGASRGIGRALVGKLLEMSQVSKVIATARTASSDAGLAALAAKFPGRLVAAELDLTDPSSIENACDRLLPVCPRLDLLVNTAGVLHDEAAGIQPEKKLAQCEASQLHAVFAVNAVGPLLMAKHFGAWLQHKGPSMLVNVSARVGSIGDNRLGGWYAYRMTKAAQNMATRNLAIELGRRAPGLTCIAYHPGTVDTALSAPFQKRVADGKLFSPEFAATCLLDLVAKLGPEDTGSFWDWEGKPVPW